MKILLVSDLHYALKQFDWTANVARDFDLVVIAGDHLDITSPLDGGVQVTVVLKFLQRLSRYARVVISSGNHDLDRRTAAGERFASWMDKARHLGIPADGDTVIYDDTLVSICPWWEGPETRQAVYDQLAEDSQKPRRKWIWVYHAPPQKSPTSWDGQKDYGDPYLSAWIDEFKPDFVLAGHIHQAPFKEGGSWVDRIDATWVFNCGRQIGPTPPHVIIDTAVGAAAWFSQAGMESVRLDLPLQRPVRKLEKWPSWLEPLSVAERGLNPAIPARGRSRR